MSNLQKTLTAGMMHGLKFCLKQDSGYDTEMFKDYTLDYMTKDGIGNIVIHSVETKNPFKLYEIYIYLFPMSALTKEIEFKGERFVPLHEMAKIALEGIIIINGGTEWLDVSSSGRFEVATLVLDQEYYFAYCANKESFIFGISTKGKFRTFAVKSQKRLFELFREWMFNIDNLYPEEFIEVTEDNNPYK